MRASLADACHLASDQKNFEFATLVGLDQRLRWLALWLNSGLQKPFLSEWPSLSASQATPYTRGVMLYGSNTK